MGGRPFQAFDVGDRGRSTDRIFETHFPLIWMFYHYKGMYGEKLLRSL